MNIQPQLVKYIFQADYKDGTKYVSNQEDVSIQDPQRSCYYDVKQDQLVRFFVFNDEHTYSVNLEDGHFEIDGVPFFMHEAHVEQIIGGKKVVSPLKDFRLIFFRRHTHDFNADGQQLKHTIVYRIGWQCTVNGQNYQQVMQID